MLYITVPSVEWYDESTNTFHETKEQKLQLEHSLVSLSKWESRNKKPFLNQKDKHTPTESLDYIKCMTITQNVSDEVYNALMNFPNLLAKINEYIDDPMTATWFSDQNSGKGRAVGRIITSELIYCWMISFQIPIECEKWHLNRLLTLIKVCNEENKPKKKMSKKELAQRNTALNASRLAAAKRRR